MTDQEIVIRFPDGTEIRTKTEGVAVDMEKQSEGFAWAVYGLRFRFPAPDGKTTWEFTMSKADAMELKKLLDENLEA